MGDDHARSEAQLNEQIHILSDENEQLRVNLNIMTDIRTRLSKLSERQMMLNQISHDLNTLDLKKVFSVTVRKMPLLIQAKYCSLYLQDHSTGELVLECHNFPEQIEERIRTEERPDTIMSRALQSRQTIHIAGFNNYEQTHQVTLDRTSADRHVEKTFLSTPLLLDKRVVGVLNFGDKHDDTFFDAIDDIPLIEQLHYLLTMCIRNCQLFKMTKTQAMTDVLTGLANHRSFINSLESEIQRGKRHMRNLSLVLIDIDKFKSINDTYGHPAGDYVLQEASRIIRSILRKEDFPARQGGDELAIILPETSAEGAEKTVARIVEAVRRHEFTYANQVIRVTASIGLATFQKEMDATDFLKCADKALYLAKEGGRDQYAVYQETFDKKTVQRI